MKFYSGFCLKNEEYFFQEFLDDSVYTVSGFSYGAIKAFEDVQKQLASGNRVDRLQLFSPAFFQTKSVKFKRLQTISYKKNQELYIQNFIRSCFTPYTVKKLEYYSSSIEELEELMAFEWSIPELMILEKKGVQIEVYLGSKDNIIDVEGARELFLEIATVTYIKNANHFLQLN